MEKHRESSAEVWNVSESASVNRGRHARMSFLGGARKATGDEGFDLPGESLAASGPPAVRPVPVAAIDVKKTTILGHEYVRELERIQYMTPIHPSHSEAISLITSTSRKKSRRRRLLLPRLPRNQG